MICWWDRALDKLILSFSSIPLDFCSTKYLKLKLKHCRWQHLSIKYWSSGWSMNRGNDRIISGWVSEWAGLKKNFLQVLRLSVAFSQWVWYELQSEENISCVAIWQENFRASFVQCLLFLLTTNYMMRVMMIKRQSCHGLTLFKTLFRSQL